MVTIAANSSANLKMCMTQSKYLEGCVTKPYGIKTPDSDNNVSFAKIFVYYLIRIVTRYVMVMANNLTTRLLSIERAHWPTLHDMFKAVDDKAWQREFPVEFPVKVCARISY